jgi:hypothetical protein
MLNQTCDEPYMFPFLSILLVKDDICLGICIMVLMIYSPLFCLCIFCTQLCVFVCIGGGLIQMPFLRNFSISAQRFFSYRREDVT